MVSSVEVCLHLFFLGIFVSRSYGAYTKIDPLVQTELGLIKGLRANDGDYSMFMGIPYAQVNASNPFGASLPPTRFEGIFEALNSSAICPQYEIFQEAVTGSLDCLHLNIYVPTSASSQNRLPIMVWIHGGGFTGGSAGKSIYGPKFIVRHGVILVTVNYRLGPYGFMCLDTPEVPGNQGLKDQLTALRWIKRNINSFGGDTSKITVFGESAGGVSVDLHLMSPTEKLFDQSILQSGTSLIPIYYAQQRNAPQKIAAYLGYPTSSIDDAITFLAGTDTKLIIAAALDLGLQFSPCIEKQFDGVESFLIENWVDQTVIPKVNKMPILIGYNSNELHSTYFNKTQSFYDNLNIFNERLSACFDVRSVEFSEMETVVKHFYLGDDNMSLQNSYTIGDFDSDFVFVHPTYRTISKYLENSPGNIYNYMFSYSGNRQLSEIFLNMTSDGAAHADDIGYLFDVESVPETSDDDQKVLDRMTTMWTNFAKYGDPTPAVTDLLETKWEPITKSSATYNLEINLETSMHTSRPFNMRMTFWDLFYRAYESLQIVYPDSE
ncbi:hypothetical protein ACJJTC_011353 [Scirpophaga incertulas]